MFDAAESPPSPTAIAAGVHRPAKLQALALRVAALERRREEIQTKMRELVAAHHDSGQDLHRIEIRQLEIEREEIQEKARPLLSQLRGMRAVHAERVAEALAELRRVTARQSLGRIVGLRGDAALLAEIGRVVYEAGGPEPDGLARVAAATAAGLGLLEIEARAAATAA